MMLWLLFLWVLYGFCCCCRCCLCFTRCVPMFTLSFTHFQWFYTRCGDSSRFLLTSVLKLTIKSHLRDNKRRIYGRIYIICMRLELTIRIHEKDIKPKKLMHFENYSGWIYMVQKHKHLIYLQETYHHIIWSSTKLKLVSSTTSNVWYIQVRLEKLWKSMKCLEFADAKKNQNAEQLKKLYISLFQFKFIIWMVSFGFQLKIRYSITVHWFH